VKNLTLRERIKQESPLLAQYFIVVIIFASMITISSFFSLRIVKKNLILHGEELIMFSAETLTAYLRAHQIAFESVAYAIEDIYSHDADIDSIKHEVSKATVHLIAREDSIYSGFISIYGFIGSDFIQALNTTHYELADMTTRPWYIGAYGNNGETFFSDPYYCYQSNDLIISLSKVLLDVNNVPFGVLSFDIEFTAFSDYVSQIRFMDSGYGALLDSHLRIMAHTEELLIGSRLDELYNQHGGYAQILDTLRMGNELSAYRIVSYNGVDSIFFSRVIFNGWHIFLGIPIHDFYQDADTMQLILLVTGIVSMILLCGIMTFMYAARKRSDEASRLKSSFLANMSHEIRTPMNSIIGISELLMNSHLAERDKKFVNDIHVSANSLLSIINDILDMSKIEAGKYELNPVHYDFLELVDDVVSMFMFVAKNKGIEFIFSNVGEMPVIVYGDDIRLRQVLTNICGNAVKFTESGSIWFNVTTIDDKIKFEVKDTGIGIRQDELPNIFRVFEQSTNEKSRRTTGTGLGLPISKAFIDMMSGKIDVESEYGKGSVFTVTIPLVLGDPTEIKRSEDYYDSFGIIAIGANVLVVDDNEYNLRVAVGLLELFGIDAHTASSGKEAIEMVSQSEYDLVFMDHMMPEMDGIEATAMIRKLGEEYKNLKIIALSANAIQGAREMFLHNGFDGFVSKPIEIHSLIKTLIECLPSEKVEHIPEYNPDTSITDKIGDLDAFIESLNNVSEINVEVGLFHVDNHKEMYRGNLKFFYNKLITDCDKLSASLKSRDLSEFSIIVHGTKSALASIGATSLSAMALKLETASNNNDIEYCAEQFPHFLKRLTALYQQLEDVFSDDTVVTEKEIGNSQHIRNSVENAKKATDIYDNDAAIEIICELQAYDFGNDTGVLLEDALTALKHYKYNEAKEILSKITD
jgi:signal transduction histidine kinase/DNA-binding response OmpR family regulator